MCRLALGLAVGVILCAAAPSLAQQGTAEIVGRVTDTQGAVLPGVAIVVTNEETGVYREVVTGPDGSYSTAHIVPGRYRISAQLAGFRGLDRRGISVSVGALVSGHKSNSGNWLPSSLSLNWEPTSKIAVEMGIFSKSVT